VRRAGVLLGAPGGRKGEDGTLWQEFPAAGSPSTRLEVKAEPAAPDYFRRHASQVEGDGTWRAASGARGLTKLTLTLAPAGASERRYRVRLYFAEPDK